MPRFDSPPVFGALLDEDDGGRFAIGPADVSGRRRSATCRTPTSSRRASTRPTARSACSTSRRASCSTTAASGRPSSCASSSRSRARRGFACCCDPILGWSQRAAAARVGLAPHRATTGYDDRAAPDDRMRRCRTSTASRSRSRTRKHFVLAWGAPVEEPLAPLCERFLRETVRYWQLWVKHCDIPPIYQEEVIRSALALKLHCFEDTGAIVAALTTSIPEVARLGSHLGLPLLLAARRLLRARRVPPARALRGARAVPALPAERRVVLARSRSRAALSHRRQDRSRRNACSTTGPASAGDGPVRVGNARRPASAARRVRRDGARADAAVPRRALPRAGHAADARSGHPARAQGRRTSPDSPTPGIWEFRSEWRPQTLQLAHVLGRRRSHEPHRRSCTGRRTRRSSRDAAERIRDEILREARRTRRAAAWSPTTAAPRSTPRCCRRSRCACCRPDDPRLHATVDAVSRDLDARRVAQALPHDDGFGVPAVAFMLCTFWLVEALATAGTRRRGAARSWTACSPACPRSGCSRRTSIRSTGVMWGNFPQAYSHVGLIHAAFAAAPRWSEFGS